MVTSPAGLFFVIILAGGGDVNKLIARLIDCGMEREIALAVYRDFKRRGKLSEFERYVENVEYECQEQEEYA